MEKRQILVRFPVGVKRFISSQKRPDWLRDPLGLLFDGFRGLFFLWADTSRSTIKDVGLPPLWDMDVCCECCVLWSRGLCDGLLTRPEESYRLWCVSECDCEPWTMRRPRHTGRGLLSHKKKIPGGKRVKREADHWPLPSAETKNAWVYTSIPPHDLMEGRIIQHSFYFTTCDVYRVLCYVVGSWRLMPPDALQPKAYCTNLGL